MTPASNEHSAENAHKRAVEDQQKTLLLSILHAQAGCGYGQHHRFAEITGTAEYTRLPLMTYDDVQDFDAYWSTPDNVTVDRISAYFLTSGSSAAPKRIPVTTTLVRQKAKAFATFWDRVYDDHPALRQGKFIANFGDSGHSERDENNVPQMSETTFWNQRMQGFQPKDRWPIPRQLTAITNAEHRYYAAARLALQGPLHCLMSLNPSTLVKFCDVITTHHQSLANGLRSGGWGLDALDADTTLPTQLTSRLTVSEDAAARVRALTPASENHWQLTDLWAELELIICWQSELVAPYLQLLRRHSADVAFRDYITQSSECIMAIPVRDGQSGGLLAHESHFFEFIPAETQHLAQPQTLTATQLVPKSTYELVVTTGGGLYRYRTGDCIRVNHFEQGIPHISFQYRFGRTSSITGEKLTEQHVLSALDHPRTERVLTRRDVLVFPRTGERPHYAVLVAKDMLKDTTSDVALADWVSEIHEALGDANGEYQDKCASLRLGKPVVLVTDADGIASLHKRFRAAHVGDDQFKPGILRRERDLDQYVKVHSVIHAHH
ncbi:MAG: GH3 auxin-responsive promoter family protein [Pseudomonadota bacterium]